MYQPKTYPEEPCFHIGYGFKNPALCRVNGVLYSYCCLCKTYIGNEYDTNWYKLIKQEYCDSCRLKVQTEQNSNRQKKFRKKNKQEKKLLRNQNALLQDENRLLREMVVVLRDDLEQLKQQQL